MAPTTLTNVNYFFSPSKLAFYVNTVHGSAMPADAVAITTATYNSVQQQLTAGGTLTAVNTQPVVVFTPPTKTQLISFAQSTASNIKYGGLTVNIAAAGAAAMNVVCATDANTMMELQMAAAEVNGANVASAGTGNALTQSFAFPNGSVLTLTGTQMLTIFAAVQSYWRNIMTQLTTVITAINGGTITTFAQVTTPPSPIPAWPVIPTV
jgi:hypothetical protein